VTNYKKSSLFRKKIKKNKTEEKEHSKQA